jgi:lipopolysaccharide export system protein LptC
MTPVLRQGWEKFSLYLPIILMGMLALGTWWLVRNAPAPVAAAAGPQQSPPARLFHEALFGQEL